MKYRYEELEVGDRILVFIDLVYCIAANLPADEKYALSSQMRRSAMSVYLNLAEGSARNSKRDFARFITIALGSLVETHACIKIASRRGYVEPDKVLEVQDLIKEIWFKLVALRRSQV